ncbi:hypothetical protein Tco_0679332 [Tanacetum coccineum]|uniref:Reverse transcriptase domain-containing protein n=1 Tax=Tanacetum coccineum TaxID=301880 RepID=A0ABQ4XHJ2_9ASTR
MEEDYEKSGASQRRVNPKIHDVIKKEVEKLLDAGLIYPISDSPWVSPTFSKLATVGLLAGHYVANYTARKNLIQDSIGPHLQGCHMTLSPVVTFVNVKEKFTEREEMHKTPSKFANSLTSGGALILWGRSRLQRGVTNTYSWLLTICQNGSSKALPTNDATMLSVKFLKLSLLSIWCTRAILCDRGNSLLQWTNLQRRYIPERTVEKENRVLPPVGKLMLLYGPCATAYKTHRVYPYKLGTDNQEKDEKQSQNDKTGLGMEKL